MSSSSAPRVTILRSTQEFVDNALSTTELGLQFDAELSGLSLYPPESVLDIGHAAGQVLEGQPQAAINAILHLISSENRATRAVACAMISRLARFNPGLWANIIRHLAADSDWEVRGFASRAYDSRGGYSGAVEFHTDWVFAELELWVEHENYLLRHAATEALLGFIPLKSELVPRLLKMLNPLLCDPAEYVRRGLVVSLRTMGRAEPNAVFDYLSGHLPPPSEEVREVLHLVLADSFAAKDPKRKADLLTRLQIEQI